MKLMGALELDSLTKSQTRGSLLAINLIKEKKWWKTEMKDVRRWKATNVLHT